MKPIIYPKLFETSPAALLNTNGEGILSTCSEFLVTEEKNDEYTFTAKLKDSDPNISALCVGAVIKAKANPQQDAQLFVVHTISVDKAGVVSLSGVHIRQYFLLDGTIPTMDNLVKYDAHPGRYLGIAGTASETISNLRANGTWYGEKIETYGAYEFMSDIETSVKFKLGYYSAETFNDILFNGDEGIVAKYGGELKYDNFTIWLLKNRGQKSGHRLVFGSNLSDYNQTNEYNVNSYTHILPYATINFILGTGSIEQTVYGSLTAITDESDDQVMQNVYRADCTDDLSDYNPTWGSADDWAELMDKLADAGKTHKPEQTGSGTSVSIDVTVACALDEMRDLRLCDWVTVVTRAGEEISAQIIKATYDSVSERYTDMVIGSPKPKLSNFLKIERRVL